MTVTGRQTAISILTAGVHHGGTEELAVLIAASFEKDLEETGSFVAAFAHYTETGAHLAAIALAALMRYAHATGRSIEDVLADFRDAPL